MHLVEFGETNRLPCQSFNAGSEGEVLPFDLLGIRFADRVPFGWQVAFVSPPIIRVKSGDPEKRQQFLEL